MDLLSAGLLGIVEGLTEFLPISSTAHLELVARFLNISQTDFVKTFTVVIQFGAILAVVVLYAQLLIRNKEIWKKIFVSFLPTAFVGFILYAIIKRYLLGNYELLIWTIGIGGIVIIITEYFLRESVMEIGTERELTIMPYSTAFFIGLAQSVAVIPGVSRSAATIIAGRLLGVSRRAIVEFSFLLAIPTMAAAAGYDLIKSPAIISGENVSLLAVGFVAAFISAIIAVKLFLKLVKETNLIGFGVYRVILAILLFLIL